MVSKNTGAGKRGLDCGPGAGQTVRECLAGDFFSVVGCLLALGVGWMASRIMKCDAATVEVSDRVVEVCRRVLPPLQAAVQARGLMVGAPVFLRSFKESFEIEVWLEPGPGRAFEHFRPTPARLSRATGHPSIGFWQNLAEGYDFFERRKRPPRVFVVNRRYGFRDEASSEAATGPVVEGQISSDKPGWTVDGG